MMIIVRTPAITRTHTHLNAEQHDALQPVVRPEQLRAFGLHLRCDHAEQRLAEHRLRMADVQLGGSLAQFFRILFSDEQRHLQRLAGRHQFLRVGDHRIEQRNGGAELLLHVAQQEERVARLQPADGDDFLRQGHVDLDAIADNL